MFDHGKIVIKRFPK